MSRSVEPTEERQAGRLVAVYGTLKRGYENYERLLATREPVLCTLVELPYEMYANPDYPMLVPSEERHPILLEVFEVDDAKLAELDALEEPYGYFRESVHLDELGRSVELYVHPRPPPGGFSRVASGDWAG